MSSTATTTPTTKESSSARVLTLYEPQLTAPPLPTNVKPLTDWEATWKALGGILHPGSFDDDDFEQMYDAIKHDGAEILDKIAGRDLFKDGRLSSSACGCNLELTLVKGDDADLEFTKEVLEGLRDCTIVLPVMKEAESREPVEGRITIPVHRGDKEEPGKGKS